MDEITVDDWRHAVPLAVSTNLVQRVSEVITSDADNLISAVQFNAFKIDPEDKYHPFPKFLLAGSSVLPFDAQCSHETFTLGQQFLLA